MEDSRHPAKNVMADSTVHGNVVMAGHVGHLMVTGSSVNQDLLAGGWMSAQDRLADYLAAAGKSYPHSMRTGVLLDDPLPPLLPMFVQQDHYQVSRRGQIDPQEHMRTPVHDLMNGDGDCLLLGAAGAGKTSALRSGAVELIQQWKAGRNRRWVPVCVRAADLVAGTSLPAALAAAVEGEFGAAGVRRTWSVDFFREAPTSDSRWLVLVDGVDEVLSTDHRGQLMRMVKGAAVEQGTPYRFVLASRPLPEKVFTAAPRWRHTRYRLLPLPKLAFTAFARAWFSAFALDDPDRSVEDFLNAINIAGVAKLSRVPLMASMLCQLFAVEPGRRLPTSRLQLFARYSELLLDRMHTDGASGVAWQLRVATDKYGEPATVGAHALLGRIPDVVGAVALAQQQDQALRTTSLFDDLTGADRPIPMDIGTWQDIVHETARRTGLFTQQGSDLVFTHRFLGEFLAARQLRTDRMRSLRTYLRLFGWFGNRNPLWSSPFPMAIGTRSVDHDSFTRFLIESWAGLAAVDRSLRRLASRRGLNGMENCRLVAQLADDGMALSPRVRAAASRTLLRLAQKTKSDPRDCLDATLELAKLESEDVPELFASLATNSAVPYPIRLRAATELAKSRVPGAGETLVRLVNDDAGDHEDRLSAALELARIDPATCAPLLDGLVGDNGLSTELRFLGSVELARIDRTRGANAMIALLPRYRIDLKGRLLLALELAKVDGGRAVGVLDTLASLTGHEFGVRFSAAVELQRLGGRLGAHWLYQLAADIQVKAPHRLLAAMELSRSDPATARGLLHVFAVDPERHPEFRFNAATELVRLEDPRAADVLVDLVSAVKFDDELRIIVLTALARTGDARTLHELARMTDPVQNPHTSARKQAESLLDRLIHVEGLDGWAGVARIADLAIDRRVAAVQRLGRLGVARARDLLVGLAADESFDQRLRTAAREILDRPT